MNANEIEPGMILLGPNGIVREVVAMVGKTCWYVTHGQLSPDPTPITAHGLARWTKRDITELRAAS